MMLFLLFIIQTNGATEPVEVKDLRPHWLHYTDGNYQSVGTSPINDLHTIYFYVKPQAFKGHNLSINSAEDWDLFVNGSLIFSGRDQLFSMDSLAHLYSQELFFGIHTSRGVVDLTTRIVSPTFSQLEIPKVPSQRQPTFFRDYVILVTSFLLLFLLILFRTNPQLTLDYFSFAKIFSVQERNENLLASRITSSVNLLFYLFCALLTGFLLSAIFYFAGPYFHEAKFMGINSLAGAFLVWLRLSMFILVLLISKLVIVLLFSSLFNFRETVSFQFFNFLRFVLFTSVIMALSSLVYFVFKGEQALFYEQLMVLALVLMSAGSVMVLIKLLARASFSFFHLFSYLCASEIIPLVIIIKIFF